MRLLLSALCILTALCTGPVSAGQAEKLPEFAVWQVGTPPDKTKKAETPALAYLTLLPGGKIVIAGFEDGRVEFHDTINRERTRVWKLPENSTYEGVSPDGLWALTQSNDDLWKLFDLRAEPKLVSQFIAPAGSLVSFQITPDHERMLTLVSNRVSMWDMATGIQQWERTAHDVIGFRRDHAELIVQTTSQEISILDPRSGKLVETIECENSVSSLRLLPDEQHLLGPGEDEDDDIWVIIDLANKVEHPVLPRPAAEKLRWSLLPDGRSVAFGFEDGQVLLNEWPSGRIVKKLRPPKNEKDKYSDVNQCEFSADGSVVLLINDGSVLRLDPDTGNYTDRYAPWSPPPTPDTLRLFTFIDSTTLAVISPARELAVHRRDQPPGPTTQVPGRIDVTEFLVAPDGRRAAVFCTGKDPDKPGDNTRQSVLHLFDFRVREWKSVALKEQTKPFQFSPDGKSLYGVTATETDSLFEIRDAATGMRTDTVPAPRGPNDEDDEPPAGKFVSAGPNLLWIPNMGQRQVFNRAQHRFEIRDRTKRHTKSDGIRLPGGRLTVRSANQDVEISSTLEAKARHSIGRSSHVWLYPEAVHPSGRYMLIDGEHEGSYLHLLDVAGRKYLHSFPCTGYTNYDFTTDGKLMVADSEGILTVWNIEAIVKATAEPKPLPDKQIAAAWQKLHKNGDTIETLVRYPAQALAYARKHLKPAEPFPQERAIELLTDLNHDDIEVRLKAFRELKQADARVKPVTEKFLKTSATAESTRLCKIALSAFTEGEHPTELYAGRVIEVLHHLRRDFSVAADPKLRLLPMAILSRLARGPAGAALTEEAKLEMTEPE